MEADARLLYKAAEKIRAERSGPELVVAEMLAAMGDVLHGMTKHVEWPIRNAAVKLAKAYLHEGEVRMVPRIPRQSRVGS